MNFEEAHEAFVQEHLAKRQGERRNRLERGHAHAEVLFLRNVWWPLRGNFQHLHPEFEVLDWKGYPYYANFAWLPGYIKLIIEIKGYNSHIRNMDRTKFCNELNRETFLFAMGFHIISFAYDDVERRPELCRNLLRMVLSKYLHAPDSISVPILAEKEVIRLAIQSARPLRPIEIRQHLSMDYRTTNRILSNLCAKGWLRRIYGPHGQRVMKYELVKEMVDFLDA